MTSIEVLKLMNYTKIDCLRAIGSDFKRNDLIRQLLKDEACFFKINKEDALLILKSIGVSEENLEKTYSEVTSKDLFMKLVEDKKVNKEDEDLKIRF